MITPSPSAHGSTLIHVWNHSLGPATLRESALLPPSGLPCPTSLKFAAGTLTKRSFKKPEKCGASERQMQAAEQTVAGQRAADKIEVVHSPVIETGQAVAKARASRPTLPGLSLRKSRHWRDYGTVHSQPHGALHDAGNRTHAASLLAWTISRATGPWHSAGRGTFAPAGTRGSDRLVELATPRGVLGRRAVACWKSQWRCGQAWWVRARAQARAKEEAEWREQRGGTRKTGRPAGSCCQESGLGSTAKDRAGWHSSPVLHWSPN